MATAQSDIQNKIRKGKVTSEKENLEDYLEIADEKVSAEQIKLSSEEDLESLLRLAEKLKENINEIANNPFISRYRFMQFFGLISAVVWLLYSSNHFGETLGSTKIIPSLLFSIPVILAEYRIRIIKARSLPDKLAIKEVLQLLREVHGTIADREDWSILKRAEFRIRLSRFDLSEKKDSVFNFLS